MTANDSGGNRRFIYDGTSIVGEQDIGSGNFIVVYDHGNGGLARQTRGTATSYYQYDGLGSTRQLTDANQAVTDAVSYDAWGNILSSSGATANAFKYVGRLGYYADGDSGLMMLQARYYSASVGRFWTVDPSRQEDNLYAYARNNPLRFVDPDGTDCWEDCDKKYNDDKKKCKDDWDSCRASCRWWALTIIGYFICVHYKCNKNWGVCMEKARANWYTCYMKCDIHQIVQNAQNYNANYQQYQQYMQQYQRQYIQQHYRQY